MRREWRELLDSSTLGLRNARKILGKERDCSQSRTKQTGQIYSNRYKRLEEFIHRIVATKKGLFRFNIKSNR